MSQDISYSDNAPHTLPNAPAVGIDHELSVSDTVDQAVLWYVLRDLKRPNSKTPAHKMLTEMGVEVFTPMKWVNVEVNGRRRRQRVPVLNDLVFVHASRLTLDPVIAATPTLQYRYVRGAYCKPLVVRTIDMERFIRATSESPDPQMLSISEISSLSIGKEVKIVGGAFDGIVGRIVNVRGARKKRILVCIPDIIAAVVEVDPQYVVLRQPLSNN